MNDAQLAVIINSYRDQPTTNMTDDQLSPWLRACKLMELSVRVSHARRDWRARREEAEAELARRRTGLHCACRET